MELINKLLVRDPAERLSAEALLQSRCMPPPPLDVEQFFRLVENLISSKIDGPPEEYHRLMSTCLNQYTLKEHILKWLIKDDCIHSAHSGQNASPTHHIFPLFIETCQGMGAQFLLVLYIYPCNLDGLFSLFILMMYSKF